MVKEAFVTYAGPQGRFYTFELAEGPLKTTEGPFSLKQVGAVPQHNVNDFSTCAKIVISTQLY